MKTMFVKKLATVSASLLLVNAPSAFAQVTVLGQKLNTITTAVPFLRISPDSRAGAMGDVGLATDADANDMHWNVAKLSANKKVNGASLTYTPWLRDLVPDINLVYLSGFHKLNNFDAFGASIRYFNLGQINFKDINAQDLGTGFPREWAIDLGYSRKLNNNFHVGVAGRYVNSNLSSGPAGQSSNPTKAGTSFAVDMAAYYTKPMNEEEDGDKLSIGLAITNLGQKVSYNNLRRDFLPTNLGLGAAYTYKIDEFNSMKFALDMNKLLVPSPYFEKDPVTGNDVQKYNDKLSVVNGVFSSFGDAPGKGKEEFNEITWGLGTEYVYQNQFFARAGYFYEHPLKGARKYATVGLGFKYNVFTLNLAYLVPSGSGISRNPLSNTLRFTLLFDLDAAKKAAPSSSDDDENGATKSE
jgi:hypothetical protein